MTARLISGVGALATAFVATCAAAGPIEVNEGDYTVSQTQTKVAPTITWSYGIDMTSNYIWAGETQSDGNFAIQPWVEVETNGFYLGFWGSSVDFGDADDWELDLYLGYRRDVTDNFSYDLSLARYAYDDSGYASSEAIASGTYAWDNGVSLEGMVAYDWENSDSQYSVTLGYDVNDRFNLSGRFGQADGADTDYYWDVGMTYAFTDTVYGDLRYHGSDLEDEGVVAMIGVAF